MKQKQVPFQNALVQQQFYRLMIISSFVFVVSALFLRIITNLQTTVLLNYFDIKFQYRPYGIIFHSIGGTNWNDTRIMIVYGLGSMVFFVLGLILLRFTMAFKSFGFLSRLVMTWMSFLLILILPMGMISGSIIYDGFGVAYTWLFDNVLVRLMVALVVFVLTLLTRPFWLTLFLKTAFSTEIIDQHEERKDYIIRVLKVPYIAGTLIILPFVVMGQYWSWLVYLIGLGFIIFPVLNPQFPIDKPRITRTAGPVLNSRYAVIFMIMLILWFFSASFIRIEF